MLFENRQDHSQISMATCTDLFLEKTSAENLAEIRKFHLCVDHAGICDIALSKDRSEYTVSDGIDRGLVMRERDPLLEDHAMRKKARDKVSEVLAEVCGRSTPKGIMVNDIYRIRRCLEEVFL